MSACIVKDSETNFYSVTRVATPCIAHNSMQKVSTVGAYPQTLEVLVIAIDIIIITTVTYKHH